MSFGPVGGQHQPGVEDAAVVDAAAAQLGEGGRDEVVEHLLDDVLAGAGHRRVRPHAAGVRAPVAVADPLEVLGRGQGDRPLAVAHGQQAELGARHVLLDDHPVAGVAEGLAGELGPDVVLGLDQVGGDQHALAGRQPVGLDHVGAGEAAEELQRRFEVVEGREAGGGDPGRGHDLLHPRLRALEPGAVGAGAEDQLALGPEPVGQAVDQRRFGADHEQVGIERFGRGADRTRDAGVPGRDDDVGGTAEHGGERVFTTSGPDDDDLHRPASVPEPVLAPGFSAHRPLIVAPERGPPRAEGRRP